MHRGFTKRWRKRWDAGYHKDPLLWAMMDYFIDHANWEDRETFINGQIVLIHRGQHIFGSNSLANFFGVGRQQIRSRLALMKEAGFLTITSTNKYSIATICNYVMYQVGCPATQPASQPEPNQHSTTPKELKNNTSAETSNFRKRYLNQDLIDQAFQAIASTRKSNRIADAVLLAQLKKWDRYPVAQVEAGIRTYLDKNYAGDGKGEAYLLGIIRNNHRESVEKNLPHVPPSKIFNFGGQFHEE